MLRQLRPIFSATAFIFWCAISHPASAVTYFVSADGNDRSSGSKENPWRTLQHAADRSKPGDEIVVSAGTYKPFHVTRSGTPNSRISFIAASPAAHIKGYEIYDDRHVAVSILASFITFKGFEVDVGLSSPRQSRGIRVSGTHSAPVYGVELLDNKVANAGWVGITTSYAEGVRIEGNRVWGSRGQHGIYVANSADSPVVRDNVSFDNAQAGIQINADPELPGDGVIRYAVVENNVLYGNGRKGSAALNLASVQDSKIVGNLIYRNFAQGIASWDDEAGERYGCKNNVYLNNTVVMPEGAHHALSFRHGSSGNTVYNNVLLHLGGKDSLAVDKSSAPALKSDYNIVALFENPDGALVSLLHWQEAMGLDRHSFVAAATDVFSDHTRDRYDVTVSSPAVDRGLNHDAVKRDIRGVIRPQGKAIDIGAFEYGTNEKANAASM